MSSEGQGTLTVATLRRQRVQRQEVLRRVLPIAMIAVIVAAVRTKPGPGAHGLHLGIALVVAGMAVTTVGLLVILENAGVYVTHPGLGLPGVIAAVATLLTALFARRIDVQDAQADRMLVELEQTPATRPPLRPRPLFRLARSRPHRPPIPFRIRRFWRPIWASPPARAKCWR